MREALAYQNSLSVVIPAYNEEQGIEPCILSLERELNGIVDDFEIIVVNDGSSDRTAQVLEMLRGSRPYLKIIHNPSNLSLGGTLRRGFSITSKGLIFYCDADMPFDFRELRRALLILNQKNCDLLIGYRLDRSSERILRRLYAFVYNHLLRLVFGLKVRDVNFAFKFIKRSALGQMQLRSRGSFIDAEILIKAQRMGFSVDEIGIPYLSRRFGKSTLGHLNVVFKILWELLVQYPQLTKVKPIKQ